MNDIQEQLKLSGQKVTKHKLTILSLFNHHKHLTAKYILKELQNQNIDISLATVYRVLSAFELHKLITKHNFGNDYAIYELDKDNDHHDHLICIHCGKVIEFISNEIEFIQLQIAKQANFTVLHHSLNLFGCCIKCS